MKKCIKCKVEKEIESFYKNKYSPDHKSLICKECSRKTTEKKRKASQSMGELSNYFN